MKETGELLRNRRLEKKFSLEEISSQTKIQLSILKSLEEGRAELLKNKTYTKGFLRQYARALQLNPDEVVAIFDREAAAVAPTVSVSTPVTKLKAEQPIQDKTNVLWFRAPAKMITIAGTLVIITLGAAIYFLSNKMISYSEEKFKEPTEESSTVAETAPEAAAPAEVATASPSPVPSASPSPSPTPVPEKKAEPVVASTKPSPSPTPTPTPVPEKKAEEAAVAEVAPPPKGTKEIVVVATDNVTIEASLASGEKQTIKLKNNGKHSFFYPKKITLLINNGGGVSVTANGEKLGVPGEQGQPVTLSFD